MLVLDLPSFSFFLVSNSHGLQPTVVRRGGVLKIRAIRLKVAVLRSDWDGGDVELDVLGLSDICGRCYVLPRWTHGRPATCRKRPPLEDPETRIIEQTRQTSHDHQGILEHQELQTTAKMLELESKMMEYPMNPELIWCPQLVLQPFPDVVQFPLERHSRQPRWCRHQRDLGLRLGGLKV